uniref:CCT-theta n=1 Tax=Rhizochromulina marina TaxID=1034831 RepID=A0A7S2RZC7_9STRA
MAGSRFYGTGGRVLYRRTATMSKSMNYNMAGGTSTMLKSGHKTFEGLEEAIIKNIEAAKAISTMVSSSLGPNGMNKLVVNHIGKIIVTSDCATLIKELEVAHPAAQMLSLASQMQDQELGDATNLTVSFAGELLKLAEELLHSGLHTSEIIAGYKTAFDRTIEVLPSLVCHTVENPRDSEQLIHAIKPVIMSKQYGYENLLAPLIARACLTVMPDAESGRKPSVNADAVRVVKLIGGNVEQSSVIRGMLLARSVEGTITKVDAAKITVFGCGLESESTETAGTVLIRNAEDMLQYNRSEEKALEEVISAIAATGTNVVVSGGSISEMALHYLEKYNMMAVKCMSKWDLRRLCAATGATALVRLGAATPEEMGAARKVFVKEFGAKKVTVFEQNPDDEAPVASIILRSSVVSVINDLERACDDGIACVKHLCRQPQFTPGAGATEIELATQLKALADKTDSLDQYAIRKFGEAFEVVPRTLGENAGMDSTTLMSQLYTAHQAGEKNVGVDVEKKCPGDMTQQGIVDLLSIKESAIRLAVDAAITVLRVDQIIMSKPAGGPKAPAQR